MRVTPLDPLQSPVLLLGAGSIGSRYLRLLQEQLGLRVLAVPARPERAALLRATGIEAFADVASALAMGPGTAIIATDTGRHLQDVAAVAGKVRRILVEKPLGTSRADLSALRPTVNRAAITVAYCLRFDPGLQWVREHLLQLGRIETVDIACRSYLPDWRPDRDYREGYAARPAEGGVLRDLSHELDYAVWLFGRPQDVSCALQFDGGLGIPVDVQAELQWRTETGAEVAVGLDYLTRQPQRSLRVVGQNGELRWDFLTKTALWLRQGEGLQEFHWSPAADALYLAELQAFFAPDLTLSHLATWDEGAFVLALMDAARQSAETGRTESVGV